MKKYFVFLLLVLLSLVAVCPRTEMVHASSNTVPNELKGIDFSKLPSKKDQERIMEYYYKRNKEICEEIDREPKKQSDSLKKAKKQNMQSVHMVIFYMHMNFVCRFCVAQ